MAVIKRGNYGVLYPYKKFSPGQRFFFFTSLLDKDEGPEKTGQMLAAEVEDYLEGENYASLNQKKNNEDKTLMEQSMSFLKQIIEREKKQERQYFETHIKNNKQLPPQIREKLQDCFKDEGNGSFSIDYIKFIHWINLFYSDTKEYAYLLKNETERLNEVNELIQEFKSLSEKKQREYKRKGLKEGKKSGDDSERFFIGFRNFLTEQLQKNDAGEYLDTAKTEKAKRVLDTRALINKIQDQLKKTFLTIWNSPDLKERISNILLNKTADPTELSQAILASLLSEYMLTMREQVISTLEETEKNLEEGQSLSKEASRRLAEQFVSSMELAESGGDASMKKELLTILKRAKNYAREQEKDSKIVKRLFSGINIDSIKGYLANEIVTHGDQEYERSKGGITGLTEDLITILEPALEAEAKAKDIKLVKPGDDKTRRAALIQNLIRLAEKNGIKIKTKKKIDYKELERQIKTRIQSQNLIQINVKKNDNVLSEMDASRGLARGIAGSNKFFKRTIGEALLDGYQKSDVALIDLGTYTLTPNISDSLWESIATSIVNDYNSSNKVTKVEITSSKSTYNESAARASETRKNRNGGAFNAQEFFIEGETQRRIVSLEKTWDSIQDQLAAAGKGTEEMQAAFQVLKNGFQVSSTVKSYDKLDNDIGFHGGSLGGTLEHQLDNIYDMFSMGGIDLPDMEWMTTAVYNAGPGMLGRNIAHTLEDIFSTLAVTMLFDDAGQQASYIKSQAFDNFSALSTNFLHIYHLNGFYFPASFILQLTYDGLEKAETILLGINNSSGSRANIVNPVHQGHMVGGDVFYRDTDGKEHNYGYKIVTSEQDWYDTFEQNRKKVSVSITFLAGFLDILNKLQETMSNPFGK